MNTVIFSYNSKNKNGTADSPEDKNAKNKFIIHSGTNLKITNFSKILIAFLVSSIPIIIPFVLLYFVPGIEDSFLKFIDSNPTLAFVLMGIYAVFFLVLMTKIFEWAAAYNAKPGVIPLQADALISGIINLPNDMPIKVIQLTPNKIKLTWNYANEKFAYLFGLGKISGGYELLLKFDAQKHNVLASETMKKLRIGASGLLGINSKLSFSFFHGVNVLTFDYASGKGFTFKDGRLSFDKLYEYSFNPNELKGPIVTYITENGWNFKPKVFLF